MSDKTPTNLSSTGSQEPKSITPIALRTRRCQTQVSFFKAAQLKHCKICPSTFSTISKLRAHVINHKPNTKRRKVIEAIDFILKNSGKHHPSPTCSKPKLESAPKNLFQKFQKLFPDTCRQAIDASNQTNIPAVKNSLSSHDSTLKNSPSNSFPLEAIPDEINRCLSEILDSVVHNNHDNSFTPASSSILHEDLLLSTSSSSNESMTGFLRTSTPALTSSNSPPLHPSTISSIACLVQEQTSSNSPTQKSHSSDTSIQESFCQDQYFITPENERIHFQAPPIIVPASTSSQVINPIIFSKNTALPSIDNELLRNSPLSNKFPAISSHQEISPIINIENPIPSKINNDVQLNSFSQNSLSITTSPPEIDIKNSIPTPTDNEISILDIILTNSQESLDTEAVVNSSPPLEVPHDASNFNNSGNVLPEEVSFHSAAAQGFCKICHKTLQLENLLQHLHIHKPGPLRAKCLKGFRSAFPPSKLPKKKPAPSFAQKISTIEQTFREKFPDLPIFKDPDSSSNSSSDESILLEKMDSPPTGPPPISPFKKDLYSRVVKKGL
ncbi:hypothetical protein NPIL_354161, partial [Nephila pilipes]